MWMQFSLRVRYYPYSALPAGRGLFVFQNRIPAR